MRIVIGYPPYHSVYGSPLISQNRQFQWSKTGTVIYPVVLASAATVMKNEGHAVHWMDGIAEGVDWNSYLTRLISIRPHYIYWEVKTPVIKQTWKYIRQVNFYLPKTKVVLCGDHVTAFPEESQKHCNCTIKTGGDYDDNKRPNIDRLLTRWELYSERNGNFATTPGAYTMFGRDCWHRKDGGCTFCSWTNLYRDYSVVSVERAMEEIETLVKLGVKEVFDDSGTFPTGAWLHDFCDKIRREYHGKLTLGCNMRSGVLQLDDWKALKSAGFRLILMGLESANDSTLERLNKGYDSRDIESACRLSSKAGLDTHITAMFGYPWETLKDAKNTIGFCKHLFKKGYIKSMQATICVPYPGTRLFKECEENGWLLTRDWNKYDMQQPVMNSPINDEDLMRLINDAYKTALTVKNVARSFMKDDIKELYRKFKYLIKHIRK